MCQTICQSIKLFSRVFDYNVAENRRVIIICVSPVLVSRLPGRVDFVNFFRLLLTKFLKELKSLKHFIAKKDYITDREKTKVFKTIAIWNGKKRKPTEKRRALKPLCVKERSASLIEGSSESCLIFAAMALGFCCLFHIGITIFQSNDAIETHFDALVSIDNAETIFRSLVRSFIRCVIISKCYQNMPILPTSLLLLPTAPGSPSSPTSRTVTTSQLLSLPTQSLTVSLFWNHQWHLSLYPIFISKPVHRIVWGELL